MDLPWYDAAIIGAVLAACVHYGAVYHAPNSRDVVSARFRSEQEPGTCYKLRPVVVPCE